jgi:hypothetical protein
MSKEVQLEDVIIAVVLALGIALPLIAVKILS